MQFNLIFFTRKRDIILDEINNLAEESMVKLLPTNSDQ